MGLKLLNVAYVIRPYPEVIDNLQRVKDDNFLDRIVCLVVDKKLGMQSMIIFVNMGCDVAGEMILRKPAEAKNHPSNRILIAGENTL